MKIHVVKKGDTLYDLAQKYHVELEKLIEMNPQIADPNKIDVGMKVKIPSSPVVVEPPAGTYAHKHVVKQGDTLWKLAKAAGVSLEAMIEANPQLKNPNVLLTGEIVYIPKVDGNVPHEAAGAYYHPSGKKPTAPIQPTEVMPAEIAPPEPEEKLKFFEITEPAPVYEEKFEFKEMIEKAPSAEEKFVAEKPAKEEFPMGHMGENFMTDNIDYVPFGMPMMTEEAQEMTMYQPPHAFPLSQSEDLFAPYKIPAVKAGEYPSGEYPSMEMPYTAPATWGAEQANVPNYPHAGMPAYPGLPEYAQVHAPAVSALPHYPAPHDCGCKGPEMYAPAAYPAQAPGYFPPPVDPFYPIAPVMPAYTMAYGPDTYLMPHLHAMYPGYPGYPNIGPYAAGTPDCGCHEKAVAQETVQDDIVSIRNGEGKPSGAKKKKSGPKATIRAFIRKKQRRSKPKARSNRPWIRA